MACSLAWRLKRYGRLIPPSGETGEQPWEVFSANGKEPDIVLTIVDCRYLIVLQGQECLDTIPLICASDFLKIHQKADNLMLRYTMKGESRLIRIQFDGRNKEEAIKECSSAVEKLREYVPITTQDEAPLLPNQSPAEIFAPGTQREATVGVEPEVAQGSLSIKRLIQNITGTGVGLPRFYCQPPLEEGELEPLLRLCLLDPSFPALVERVDGVLKKILRE